MSFVIYYSLLYKEFKRRNFKFNDKYNVVNYDIVDYIKPFAKYHNNEYLTICYYNLKEKYLRGQKDFYDVIWYKLDNFYKGEII